MASDFILSDIFTVLLNSEYWALYQEYCDLEYGTTHSESLPCNLLQ